MALCKCRKMKLLFVGLVAALVVIYEALLIGFASGNMAIGPSPRFAYRGLTDVSFGAASIITLGQFALLALFVLYRKIRARVERSREGSNSDGR